MNFYQVQYEEICKILKGIEDTKENGGWWDSVEDAKSGKKKLDKIRDSLNEGMEL